MDTVYMDRTGKWIKTSRVSAAKRGFGVIAAFSGEAAAVLPPAVSEDTVSATVTVHTAGNANLLYGFYDADGRLVALVSKNQTFSSYLPVPQTTDVSVLGAAVLKLMVWQTAASLLSMGFSSEQTAIPATGDSQTKACAKAKSGLYRLRFSGNNQYLSLPETGMAQDTALTLTQGDRSVFGLFALTEEDGGFRVASVTDGGQNALTVTDSGCVFSDAPSYFNIEQTKDGSFVLRDAQSRMVLGSALMWEEEDPANLQTFELVPVAPIREREATLKEEQEVKSGADDACDTVTTLHSGDKVTVLGGTVIRPDGAWYLVTDGQMYGFLLGTSIKIAGSSIYTYEEALAKKHAAGDGIGVLGKGVDVSFYESDVDYNVLKANGYSFVIIRIGSNYNGTYSMDSYFEQNYRRATEAGMDIGIYFYTYSKTVAGAARDADQVAAWLNQRPLTYPVYYDLEDETISNACSRQTITEMARTFLSRMEDTYHYYSGVYANLNWMTNIFDSASIGQSYDLWVAAYTYSVNRDYSDRYGMWQYSGDHEYIPGIPALADLNVVYKNYPEIIKALGMSYTE